MIYRIKKIMQELLIIAAFFLLFYLLGKFNVIDTSSFKSLTSLIRDSFKSDFLTIKNSGFAGALKKRWHLHFLIGMGTVFTFLISSFHIADFDQYWQQFILIVLIAFLIQAGREFALGLFKGIPSDLSDARFGGYGAVVGMIIFGIFELIKPGYLEDIHFIVISIVIYIFTAYLVYIKKN
jgi:hypothetical protein